MACLLPGRTVSDQSQRGELGYVRVGILARGGGLIMCSGGGSATLRKDFLVLGLKLSGLMSTENGSEPCFGR